ncbi:TPR-like protein [Aspergillus leporis]|uniref:TPR-like protein n=1 Tax=Aspergillus leporis TaxID=41062 RepID=A0A5N5WFU0_9EURO|nr:TPR-like protein [Aspergillus leporis]
MASISFRDNYGGFQIGNNEGHVEFHLPPERPETPPSPLSTVPFPRNPDFVSRSIILDQICEKILVPGARIALVGLGGVGKSQLTIEYSYRVRSESPGTWVFWIHASNETRFAGSFRDIADQLKIPGRLDPNVNIFKLVENWLRDEKKGKWICILDNADNYDFLCSFPTAAKRPPTRDPLGTFTKPLLEYIPRTRKGSTIITSRSRDVALKMVNYKDLIEVKPMESSEALELLQKKLGQSEEDQDSRKLVEALEFLPLAITQAASCIRNRIPRCSVRQYLTDFQASDYEAVKLLKKETACLDRDWEAENSVLMTWQMSFNCIQRQRASAADLLSLMSFFDRQDISEDLIRIHPNAVHTATSELRDNSSDEESSPEPGLCFDFEDDVEMLRNYSFISTNDCGISFSMHRLVQLTTRAWLKSHNKLNHWKEIFISIIYREFPTGQYENWSKCRALFPHVRSAMSQYPKPKVSRLQWATILYKGAWFASAIGDIEDARDMASQSRMQRVRLLKSEHEDTLASTAMLASVHSLEGQWEKAAQLETELMQIRISKLGVHHMTTLLSMAALASTYLQQGLWQEAEKLQLHILDTHKRTLGVYHAITLKSMANLASTYREQGRWGEAEHLLRFVIENTKTKVGREHPDILSSMANLAATYMSQGQWDKAERLFLQVIELFKSKFGREHPNTLKSMGNLASTYMNQGRFLEAERVSAQIVSSFKRKLGKDHPYTITSMNNLATMYADQGRWEDAEKLQIQQIEDRRRLIGDCHPDTLTSMNNLASTYMRQHRWEEAKELHMQVAGVRKKHLGENHPDSLASLANLASTYRNLGHLKEAERLSIEVLESRKIILGNHHPDTLTSMANLASTYYSQGRWREAEKFFVQVMDTRKTNLGEDHPDTLKSVHNVASTYYSQGREEEARKLFVKAIETRKKKLGKNHPDTLMSMTNLATMLKNNGH